MTAFISRDLDPDSDFRDLLEAQGWKVTGQSLVQLSPLPFSGIPACDWIFFSSKNAVRFFFQGITGKRSDDSKSSERSKSTAPTRFYWSDDFESLDRLSKVKWAALGEATAKELAEYVGQVDFVGNGEPKATAQAFNPTPDGRGDVESRQVGAPLPSGEGSGVGLNVTVLFPIARNSRQSVQAFLGDTIQKINLEVYDNQVLPYPARRDEDVLVFTSPMNAEAYFSQHTLSKNQRVVAIGHTTAEALREMGIPEIILSAEPNERSLAEAVLGLGV